MSEIQAPDYIAVQHDAVKRPGMVCALCWEPLLHGDQIVGMPIQPGHPRFSRRAWHRDPCFNRRFPGREPREPQFNPITHNHHTGATT